MNKIIAYVDDVPHARQQLMPPAAGATPPPAAHWVLVACAPRMTHRISKWVSHSARENWRARWADKLFAQLVPQLQAQGHAVTTVLAKGPLPELTQQLKAEHGTARVLDMRRPKIDTAAPPRPFGLPGSTLGLGAMLVLFAD